MQVTWTVLKGTDRGRQITIGSGEIVLVGRGDSCDLQLADPRASRVHCRIQVSGGRIKVGDIDSEWGTFINNEEISEAELKRG